MGNLLIKKLNPDCNKPITSVLVGEEEVLCMVDTGADTPVWVSGEEELKAVFKQATEISNLKYALSGFGNGVEFVKVFRIPKFRIESDYDNDYIEYINLTVACCNKPSIQCDMILSATMFSRMNYSIVNTGYDFPLLEVSHSRSEYGILPNKRDFKGGEIIEDIQLLTQ